MSRMIEGGYAPEPEESPEEESRHIEIHFPEGRSITFNNDLAGQLVWSLKGEDSETIAFDEENSLSLEEIGTRLLGEYNDQVRRQLIRARSEANVFLQRIGWFVGAQKIGRTGKIGGMYLTPEFFSSGSISMERGSEVKSSTVDATAQVENSSIADQLESVGTHEVTSRLIIEPGDEPVFIITNAIIGRDVERIVPDEIIMKEVHKAMGIGDDKDEKDISKKKRINFQQRFEARNLFNKVKANIERIKAFDKNKKEKNTSQ